MMRRPYSSPSSASRNRHTLTPWWAFFCFYFFTVEYVVTCYSEICLRRVVLLVQVGTGQVAAAWIGLRMFGIANGQYMYVYLEMIRVEVNLKGNRLHIICIILCSSYF